MVASPRMKDLLDYLKKDFSYIIMDTPPLGILADGFSLSEYADACVYAVSYTHLFVFLSICMYNYYVSGNKIYNSK